MAQYITHSASETQALALSFGRTLPPNSVLCFFGDLGAGKTTFIKGLAQGISPGLEDQVSSPTFTYLNIYRGTSTLYHFDLYRLKDADEFLGMGFDEMFYADGICCIEWSEKIASLLPKGTICIRMSHLNESSRQIDITLLEDNG